MENEELKNYIELCREKLNPELKLLYEVSFLKIYVKFEKYLANIFEMYCVGQASSLGYCPQRKLAFTDVEHLRAVLRGESNKSYIEYIKKIQSLSKHIFIDDPFSIIFQIAENQSMFNNMIALRNYIAHESNESKKKYMQTCLNSKDFIEPGDYLLKVKKGSMKTFYSLYIEKIIEISDLILNPVQV